MLILPLQNLGLAAGLTTTIVYIHSPTTGDLRMEVVVNDVAQMSVKSGSITLEDAVNFDFDTTTGTQIGTTASQKFAFWGATAVVQQSHIADADGTLADITTKFNTLLSQLETIGINASS